MARMQLDDLDFLNHSQILSAHDLAMPGYHLYKCH